MVVKNGTKKTFEGFLNVLNVLNMSHGNGSSAFVFQVTGFLKPVTDSTDKWLWLSHSQMVGCHSLYGSNQALLNPGRLEYSSRDRSPVTCHVVTSLQACKSSLRLCRGFIATLPSQSDTFPAVSAAVEYIQYLLSIKHGRQANLSSTENGGKSVL